jgi:hypothetical protein
MGGLTMSKLAFFGNMKRGVEIISILESLGGHFSDDNVYYGSNPECVYYINDEDEIRMNALSHGKDLDEFEILGYKVYTIDKFEEIFGKVARAGQYVQTSSNAYANGTLGVLRVIAPMWSEFVGLVYHCESINDPNEPVIIRYNDVENILNTLPKAETRETKNNDNPLKYFDIELRTDEMNFFDKESVLKNQNKFWERIYYGFECNDDNKITCIDITRSDEYSKENITLKYDPNKYEMTSDDNGNIVLKAKISLPQTFEDCCNILNAQPSEARSSGYATEELGDLERLLICRDAFYKAIGFGIEKDFIMELKNAYVPIIAKNDDGNICRKSGYAQLHLLPFPKTEDRDYFFDKFYDYIDKCKKFI